MSIYSHDTKSDRINPRAVLTTCDQCHEHAPRFVTGVGINVERLCPTCAVNRDLSKMPPVAARRLQAALIDWITTPNPRLDVPDDVFYAQRARHAWTAFDLDDEAERQARKAWVASVCAPDRTRDELAALWAALTGAMAA